VRPAESREYNVCDESGVVRPTKGNENASLAEAWDLTLPAKRNVLNSERGRI